MRSAMSLIALIALGVTACGSQGAGSGQEPSPRDVETASMPTPTTTRQSRNSASPSSPVKRDPVLTDKWTDTQGYSYRFELQEAKPIIARKDIANSLPGEVNLRLGIPYTGVLTNTTPGRSAPNAHLAILPAWPEGSEICNIEGMNSAWRDVSAQSDSS